MTDLTKLHNVDLSERAQKAIEELVSRIVKDKDALKDDAGSARLNLESVVNSALGAENEVENFDDPNIPRVSFTSRATKEEIEDFVGLIDDIGCFDNLQKLQLLIQEAPEKIRSTKEFFYHRGLVDGLSAHDHEEL